jgi:3-phenylpropionate/trans-cinnamate dioxygenase ferredoxin reductase subunit
VARRTFVVVGGGLCGQRAVETLREEGFDGRVVLLAEEDEPPYDRPPLSKEFLQSDLPPEEVRLRPSGWYRENDVELRTGEAAVALDPHRREVRLQGGGRVRYDACLIATGSRVRRLRVPGADLPGVHYLRTLDDAARIRADAQRARRVAVVGAGFVGAEVAASCRRRGMEVTLIEPLPAPLARTLGEDLGGILAEIHREHGVELHMGEAVAAFRGGGRVEQVVGGSGRTYDCDFAVVGVGVVPAAEWLDGSGLRVEDGVVVDRLCRTSADGVYAAGDVARWPYRPTGEALRVEHWDNAGAQGAAAARAMLGAEVPYDPVPYFWSDQYDLRLQHVGHASRWDRVVRRGDTAGRSFSAFYMEGDRLLAALCVNRARDAMAARRLIGAGIHPSPDQLADEAVDLRRLARGS